uniref:RRM domain-containing protein n=1 Tax=Arcella intermedia TaxID=1963864 RepID=A0A6B2LN72_9EUKA
MEDLQNKLAVLEEESLKLQEMHEQVSKTFENQKVDKEESDERSVYVGNVDYQTKPKELQEHFQACGTILRVTILCDKYTGHPKGFAYLEFMEKSGVINALELNESIFKGRPLKVMSKRTNMPGLSARGRRRVIARRRSRRRGRRPNFTYSPYQY